MSNVLVVGGYGLAGRGIVRILLEQTSCNVLVAGRTKERGQKLVSAFSTYGSRISAIVMDAGDKSSVEKAIKGINLIVVAAALATHPKAVQNLLEAAVQAKVNWVDIFVSHITYAFFSNIEEQIKKNNMICVVQSGVHPGTTPVLLRIAEGVAQNDSHTSITSAQGGCAMFDKIESVQNTEEIFEALDLRAISRRIENGEFKEVGMLAPGRSFEFPVFGKKYCVPCTFSNTEVLPLKTQLPNLKKLELYQAGFNWFIDFFLIPILLIAKFVLGKWSGPIQYVLGVLVVWMSKWLSIPSAIEFLLEADFVNKDQGPKKVIIKASHRDPYFLTSVMAMHAIKNVLAGRLKPGLHISGYVHDVEAFKNDWISNGGKLDIVIQKK